MILIIMIVIMIMIVIIIIMILIVILPAPPARRAVQGKILHTRSRKSENALEDAADNPVDNSNKSPLDK